MFQQQQRLDGGGKYTVKCNEEGKTAPHTHTHTGLLKGWYEQLYCVKSSTL